MHSEYEMNGDHFLRYSNVHWILIALFVVGLGLVQDVLLPPVLAAQASTPGSLEPLPEQKTKGASLDTADLHRAIKDYREQQRAAEKESADYQRNRNKFPQRLAELERELALLEQTAPNHLALNIAQRQQQMLQASDTLLAYNQQLQEFTNQLRETTQCLNEIPQKRSDIEKVLEEASQALQIIQVTSSNNPKLEAEMLRTKVSCYKAQQKNIYEQELYYQKKLEIIQLEIAYRSQQYRLLDQQQQWDQQALIESADSAAPQDQLIQCLQRNRELSEEIVQQQQRLQEITLEQFKVNSHAYQVQQKIIEIDQLLQEPVNNPQLSKLLRSRFLKLGTPTDIRPVRREIERFYVQQMEYDNELYDSMPLFERQPESALFNRSPQALLKEYAKKKECLETLVNSSKDVISQLKELKKTKLELVREQQKLQATIVRHLFWATDANPLDLEFPVVVAKDIKKLFKEGLPCINNWRTTAWNGNNIGLFSFALLGILLGYSSRHQYHTFLQHAALRVGNVTQDSFSLTASTVAWSVCIALPLPLFIATIGYSLKESMEALGNAILATVPLIWGLRICMNFAHPQGLFIKHFVWDQRRVSKIAHGYLLVAWVVVPLIVMIITFNQLEGRQFAETLGRTVFTVLCIILLILIMGIKQTGVTFYLNRKASAQNFINRLLWNLLISTPLLASLFSTFGYVTVSQQLLFRLAGSVGIWFTLLMIYHLVWRWMLIQRRRIAFERAKQRRASKLAQRARIEEEITRIDHTLEMQLLDLDTISSRSLQLLRSMIAMATFLLLIAWWSKVHPAFGFLENVALGEVENSLQGVQSITLGKVLEAIIYMVITMQLVRNLPALLELSLLQHLDLSHGTSYAITTITKYLLTLAGSSLVIYLLGIDWSKIQWVVTALGLGLSLGLKDIFANVISGLILLFEKPIRIGDTVTVRDFHGTVTRINIRATIITDWDRKEIIVPNHTFMMEQFINWTLSDTIIRLVLQIAAPADVDPKFIKKIIKKAAKKCTLSLNIPPPEIYLNDLQQGLQTFEIRLYAAEPSHRMPLRHEFHERVLFLYRKYHITLPYPPNQIRVESLSSDEQEGRCKPVIQKNLVTN
jgi:miniconductance mechanosensitive channel